MAEHTQRVRIDDLDEPDEDDVQGFAFDMGILPTSLAPTMPKPGILPTASFPKLNPASLLGNSNWDEGNCVAGVRG